MGHSPVSGFFRPCLYFCSLNRSTISSCDFFKLRCNIIKYMYIEICPRKGPTKYGLYYQVVSLSRVILLEIASFLVLVCSGLLRQAVALSESSP